MTDEATTQIEAELSDLPATTDVLAPATVGNAPSTLRELAWQARAISSALTVPRALQDKPADILTVMLAGREIGLGPMASLRMIHIINGQTSMATELKLAMALHSGHEIIAVAEADGWCIVGCATHPGAPLTGWRMTVDTVVSEIKVSGWTVATEIMQAGKPLTDKDVWRNYERDMLFWRASAQFMRRHCPAVAGGIYTIEELGNDAGDY